MKDLTGLKFGRLTVLKLDHIQKVIGSSRSRSYWLCECECGNKIVVRSDCLTSGNTKSCGCLNRERDNQITHGLSKTKLYRIYYGMKERCYTPSYKNYKYYGAKGVAICDEWLYSFEKFSEWAFTHGYKDGLTIERINANGNYDPSNCKWITKSEQNNNTTRNVKYTYNGETLNINQWARKLNINKNTLWRYLRKKNMSIEDVIAKCND